MEINLNMSFEEAIKELEDAVALLEGGGLTLEQSITAYERAVALCGICNKRLSSAEGRVRILTEGQDGCVYDSDFVADSEQ